MDFVNFMREIGWFTVLVAVTLLSYIAASLMGGSN